MAGLLRVGLTGGIACGRSTLAASWRRPGWRLLDADAVAHALLAEGGGAVEAVVDAFGEGVRRPGAGIDRPALGRLVFGDPEARRRLEGILHPAILGVIDGDIAAFERREGSGIVVVDAALMVETGTWRRYHRIVVAHCPPEVQLRRLMARDGMDEAAARSRLAAQAPIERKMAVADYLIDTSGPLEATREAALGVAALLEEDRALLPDLPVRRAERPAC